jgi:translation elongation factor EF-Tu-like GTPase
MRRELPHVNVLTKCDLVRDKEALERLVDPEFSQLLDESDMHAPKHLRPLNLALARIIEEYSMVGFHLLDRTDEESISALMLHIDNAIQYGEDEEHREPPDAQGPDGDDAGENTS